MRIKQSEVATNNRHGECYDEYPYACANCAKNLSKKGLGMNISVAYCCHGDYSPPKGFRDAVKI